MENEWTKQIELLKENNILLVQALEAVYDWLDDPDVQKDIIKIIVKKTLEIVQ